MLYYLRNISNDKTFYLVTKIEFTVGRVGGDFTIEKDSSVSRKHAILRLKVVNNEEIVTVEDLGSKYKTFHNEQNIGVNKEIELKIGDKIRFGELTSTFILQSEKIVTTATKLTNTDKAELKKKLHFLKGEYVDNWTPDCSHLTLDKFNLTVKVLHSIIEQKPQVTSSFWKKYIENVQKNLPPPNIKDYETPLDGEVFLNTFHLKKDISRNSLFQNKVFVFYSDKEKTVLEDVILKTGGSVLSWQSDHEKIPLLFNKQVEILVMQTNESTTNSYNKFKQQIIDKANRIILLQEIAMAIISASCEKDCNPKFNRANEVFVKTTKTLTQEEPLVENTQTQQSIYQVNVKTIPETLGDQTDVPPIKKRKVEIVSEKKTSKTQQYDCQVDPEDILENRVIALEENKPKEENKNSKGQSKITKRALNKEDINDNMEVDDNPAKKKKIDDTKTEDNNEPYLTWNTRMIKSLSMNETSTKIKDIQPKVLEKCNSTKNISSGDCNSTKNISSGDLFYSKSHLNSSNCSWMSRISTINEIKEEDLDESEKKLIELFKDKIIVETVPDLVIRKSVSNDQIDFSGQVNFKKFKKVKPLHPQKTILTSDSFVVESNSALEKTLDVPGTSIDKSINKKKTKKFNVNF